MCMKRLNRLRVWVLRSKTSPFIWVLVVYQSKVTNWRVKGNKRHRRIVANTLFGLTAHWTCNCCSLAQHFWCSFCSPVVILAREGDLREFCASVAHRWAELVANSAPKTWLWSCALAWFVCLWFSSSFREWNCSYEGVICRMFLIFRYSRVLSSTRFQEVSFWQCFQRWQKSWTCCINF
jgi:hypothetical protein